MCVSVPSFISTLGLFKMAANNSSLDNESTGDVEPSHPMLNKALNVNRFPRERQMFFVLFLYMPLGIILTVLRVCISLQAMLYLLVIPNSFPLKRYFLRVLYGVLGIVVTTEDAGQASDDAKVVVSNRVSWFDHLVWQAVLRCRTTSVGMNGCSAAPLSAILNHTHLKGRDDQTLHREAEKLFPAEVERDESHQVTVVPLVAQPEPVPTNGEHCILAFSSWPFDVTPTVQPVVVTASRPLGFGVQVSTVSSGGWWDLLWTVFLPYTHFHFKFLPAVTRRQNEPVEEFTKRIHQHVARELGLQASECGQEEVNAWMEEKRRVALPVPPPSTEGVDRDEGDVPFIPINQYRQVVEPLQQPREDGEMEGMIEQVRNVFPDLPHHVIQRDLRATRSVDATVLNIVEGRVQQTDSHPQPRARSRQQQKQTANATKKEKQERKCPDMSGMTLAQRKKAMVEAARQRYLARQTAKMAT